jgi:hypothetical protein
MLKLSPRDLARSHKGLKVHLRVSGCSHNLSIRLVWLSRKGHASGAGQHLLLLLSNQRNQLLIHLLVKVLKVTLVLLQQRIVVCFDFHDLVDVSINE